MPTTVTELNSIWKNILSAIKADINNNTVFDSFFAESKCVEIKDGRMVIIAPSQLAVTCYQTNFLETIRRAVDGCTGTNYTLEFKTRDQFESSGGDKKGGEHRFFANAKLDPKYTFETFIVGSSDIEARQAATLIAANPGVTFNPLLIHGESGLGKTHLLEAIGNAIKKDNPGTKVLYISASEFIDEFVSFATDSSSDQSFCSFFRDEVDVLLLDDVQYLRKKPKTMEMFFNVFQVLANAKKQIVLTSDQDPRLIDGMDDRLKTRFSQGLSVVIQRPDIETSVQILRSKIAASDLGGCHIDDEVIRLIAGQFSSNVRELEGALNRLLFYTINIKPTNDITIDVARAAISGLVAAKREVEKPSANRVIAVVAEYYGLTPGQITGKLRIAQIALARHVAMYLCKTILGMNLSEIGKAFGKDHTSVMNAISKVENMGKTDPAMIAALKDLSTKLGA